MTTRGSVSAGLLTAILAFNICFAGDGPRVPKRHIMDESAVEQPTFQTRPVYFPSASRIEWVSVDSMGNAYSMLSNRVDPVSYDPVSGYTAIIHRNYNVYGFYGELWYNTTLGGVVWNRISSLNAGVPQSSRYPSCWIASGGGPGNELFAFSAPQLDPGTFGWVIWGFDPLNAGTPFVVEDQGGQYWTNTRVTASDDTPDIWWAAPYEPNAHALVHFWTAGFETDIWDTSLFQTPGLELGLAYRNGVLYLGGYGSLVGDPNEVMNVFYSESSDGGRSWTAPEGPNIGVGDWRTLPGLSGTAYTDWHSGDSFDMLVDAEGKVHIFGVIVDDAVLPTEIAIVEIFETGSGWDASIISDDVATTTRTDYGGVDQMGFHVNTSATPEGDVLAVFWLAAPEEGDSLPDIFLGVKSYYDEKWSVVVNVSETPDFAELLLHVAPVFEYVVDGGMSIHIARAYERGSNTYPPNSFVPTDIFAAHLVLFTNSVAPAAGTPERAALAQNYPNPFNAQTRISYTVGSPQSVVLSVFDLLGREVATLVNERKAGTHSVTWDAAGLPSGVYYYRLQAGGYAETKKLVLIR